MIISKEVLLSTGRIQLDDLWRPLLEGLSGHSGNKYSLCPGVFRKLAATDPSCCWVFFNFNPLIAFHRESCDCRFYILAKS